MMGPTDYVVRAHVPVGGGRERFTVVDRHGRILHVTMHRDRILDGAADTLIRHRLDRLGPPKPPPR